MGGFGQGFRCHNVVITTCYTKMARDYKHAGKTPSLSGKLASPGWIWFLVGLLIGLFIAALTYLSLQYSAGDGRRQMGMQPQLRNAPPPSRVQGGQAASAARTTKSTDKRSEAEFEFYTILPEREIRVPEHELRSQQPQTARKAEAATQVGTAMDASGRYILQVGSFRHLDDADRLKAKLALGGFDVEIQTVSMRGGDTWHRVRLGPYQDPAVIHRIRAGLQKNGFAPLILKEKN
uniref:Cell division protein FtsN n=1 Tax=Candidatus Kentrum sp. FW TaxID=2126338 RepID=A0A450SC15_9GAMM|nr:MAG: Cell division protein FtsN [Candidatus Kentron sp. FW]VFJ49881.1 MAG: Cell division protein FtsN [Candidatus Kentron sp. FW]